MVIDKFGVAAVRNAWYDPNKVDELVIDGYTKVISQQCPIFCTLSVLSVSLPCNLKSVITWMIVVIYTESSH